MRVIQALLRWIAGLFALAVVFLVAGFAYSYYKGDRAPEGAPIIEKLDKNESFYTAQIVDSAIALSMGSRAKIMQDSSNPGQGRDDKGNLVTTDKTAPGFSSTTYRRDVHAKSHGCVTATFQVADNVPGQLAWGVFAQPGQRFHAIIRFSSGKPQLNSDGVPDARGFAMRLLNVPGKKLLDFEQGGTGQDFVMINSKVFFIRTIEEYAAFSNALGQGGAAVVKYFFPSLSPSRWHAHEFVLANSSFKQRPESLVTEQYYSLSAYKLGPRENVKYSVRPCLTNKPLRPAYASAPNIFSRAWKKLLWLSASLRAKTMDPPEYYDYLRQELDNQVNHGGACFDFMVQPQVLNKDMPIEDTTVEWDEAASPFVKVATVTFDTQVPNTAESNVNCESLSFNPWHSLPEHQPVGVMNRVRKALYQSMGNYRRLMNLQAVCKSTCTSGGDGAFDACVKASPVAANLQAAGVVLPANVCSRPDSSSPYP